MKHIYRLLASALVLFIAAACYNEEIENPQDPDQQQSDFRITASIIQTRVSYNDRDAGHLGMKWQDGDKLYGFINGETKITFEVSGGTGGIATLVAASGSENALSSLTEDDIVDLVYTGQAASYDQGDSSITVDMTSQSGQGKIPACMHARGVVTEDNGSKCLDFHFVNDCAIFEIESLTGDISGKALDKIQIPNLFTQGQYILGEDGFNFAGVPNSQSSNYEIDVDENKWRIIDGGVVTYNSEKQPLLMAVVPIGEDDVDDNTPKIQVKALFSGESNSTFTYGKSTIQGGICYVISAHPYVARTEDNEYFETVYAAFAHAAELSTQEAYNEEDENVVTLLKSEISGLGENSYNTEERQYDDLIIDIDYHVTLDLNGCNLFLCCDDNTDPYDDNSFSGGFMVASGKNFIITDNTIAAGYIRSNSTKPIIDNYGTVTVENGNLYHYVSNVAENKSGGSLTVNGGELYSWDAVVIKNSNGTVIINDGMVDSDYQYAVDNCGTLEIYGGDVYSGAVSAIYSNCTSNPGAQITIGSPENNTDGPCIHNHSYGYPAILIYGPSSGTEVTLNMNQGLVYGSSGALYLQGKVNSYIKGGMIWSGYYNWKEEDPEKTVAYSVITLNEGVSSCVISGGNIMSGNYGQSCIFCDATSATISIKWDGTSRSEPLLYSHSNLGEKQPPIYVSGSNCTINILGGLLYEGANYGSSPSEVFLIGSTNTNFSFSDFYSNKVKYEVSGSLKDLDYAVSDKKISKSAVSINDDITIEESELSFYHIVPPGDSTPALAGTSNYYFDSFDW